MSLQLNVLKNHKKVTSLYFALLCGAVIAAGWENAPVMLYGHSHSSVAGEQQCQEWRTYPHEPYLITQIFIAREKMHWIRIQLCPADVHSSEKPLFISPIAQISQSGNFHRQSIFYILLLINYVLYQYI